VLGKLVKRGLDDELKGSAYAIVAGVDGCTHYLRFNDIESTGDAPAGAIVEARVYDDANGRRRLSLATCSDLSIEAQVNASGAAWLDRQLLAKDPPLSGGGFGAKVRNQDEPLDNQHRDLNLGLIGHDGRASRCPLLWWSGGMVRPSGTWGAGARECG
jgi:hypothetical protein